MGRKEEAIALKKRLRFHELARSCAIVKNGKFAFMEEIESRKPNEQEMDLCKYGIESYESRIKKYKIFQYIAVGLIILSVISLIALQLNRKDTSISYILVVAAIFMIGISSKLTTKDKKFLEDAQARYERMQNGQKDFDTAYKAWKAARDYKEKEYAKAEEDVKNKDKIIEEVLGMAEELDKKYDCIPGLKLLIFILEEMPDNIGVESIADAIAFAEVPDQHALFRSKNIYAHDDIVTKYENLRSEHEVFYRNNSQFF